MRYTKSLKGSVNFKRVLKQGKYVSGNIISVYTRETALKKNENYLGICVSKKHGNSVTRNKLKRWVREAYYSFEENLKKGYSIIVLYKKNIDIQNVTYFDLKEEIKDLFVKNGIFYV